MRGPGVRWMPLLAAGTVLVAGITPAAAADVRWQAERIGNEQAVVLYNSLPRAVRCTASYDTPNGIGGVFGNRRAFVVPANGRTVALTGMVWNFQIERCAAL